MQIAATANNAIAKLAGASVKPTTNSIIVQESLIAGFQYHQGNQIWPVLAAGDALQLERENDNSNDRNAIAIFFRNFKLGYVPRRENTTLARFFDEKRPITAAIIELTASDSKQQAVNFRVEMEI